MHLSRKIKLLTLILMIPVVFFVYQKTNYNNISYTVMGDGLSVGKDSYGRKDYGYGNYIKDYLIENKKLKNYSNSYTSNDMTIEMLHNYLLTNKKMNRNNKKQNIKQLLHETDYLTISVGLNDLLYKVGLMDRLTDENLDIVINEIQDSFNSLISEIRKVYNRDIYIIGYYDIDNSNKFYKKAIKKLNNIYKNNEEVIYISTYIISENRSIFINNPSSYYPNYKGYQAISSKIIDKMSKKLEK